MSVTGGQENTTAKDLDATKGKMKVQQRMIDLTARELYSTRIAMSSEKDDKTVFDENVSLIEASFLQKLDKCFLKLTTIVFLLFLFSPL